MTVWVARAGRYGERENLALEEGRAFIGWGELGDLSKISSREEVLERVEQTYPDLKLGTARNHAGQVFNFVKSFEIGDIFALPLKTRPAIAFGKVAGDYEYIAENPEDARHSRRIDWIGEPIPRSAFEQNILYSFGSALTVFRVMKNNAEERIKAVLSGKELSYSNPFADDNGTSTSDEDALDLAQIARQQISDFIGRKFKGHRMEELVAEVLRAQGFEVRVNKRKGADGGADILAGRGPMGFDDPRLCVQVKSTDAAIGSKDYDELKGVMQKFGAEHGLFVSWGGFKGTVEEEARRDFFNIRLWNAEEFVREIQDVYTKLPKELQAELPMQQVWALVGDE
ncbi:restriction system protein [Thalassospira sp. MBR-102]|uniref:restriction endonuclease n=1 Tax=Thalassospira sp. MBR-102 TaxID=3156466 RepID=UPI003390916D